MDINQCTFVGRLAADPQFKPASGDVKARLGFTLMCNRIKSEKADRPYIVAWGPVAEAGAKYLKKGREVAVTCQFRSNSQQNEDGSWTNHSNFSALSISYGRYSKKDQEAYAKQQQEGSANAGADDTDAIADRLAKEVRDSQKPSLAALIYKLKARGLSYEEARIAAQKYISAEQPASENTADEGDTDTDSAVAAGDEDMPF